MYKKKTHVDKPLLCVTYCLKLASIENMYRLVGEKVILEKKKKEEKNLLSSIYLFTNNPLVFQTPSNKMNNENRVEHWQISSES